LGEFSVQTATLSDWSAAVTPIVALQARGSNRIIALFTALREDRKAITTKASTAILIQVDASNLVINWRHLRSGWAKIGSGCRDVKIC